MKIKRMNGKAIPAKEHGASTLFITLILLLLSSLVVFYTARNAINEQRISANEVRTKQAHDAASAGLDNALAYFAKGGAVDTIGSTVLRFQTVGGFSSNTWTDQAGNTQTSRPSYYESGFCSLASVNAPPGTIPPPITCTDDGANIVLSCPQPPVAESRTPGVVSCGWSDDRKAVIRLVAKGSGTPSLAGSITAPVVTSGVSNLLTGGASVLNYFNDLTVWAGGMVPIQSNTGKTFVRNLSTDPSATSPDFRNTGNSPGCNNPPSHYTCSTDGNNLGPDVIVNDTALSSLSPEAFFANFMGKEPVPYRDTVATYKVDLNNSLTGEDSTSIGSITGKTDSVIWVEGNASGLGDIGTADHPVVLVVNGDLNFTANPVINGMVFVTGQITGNGTPTIYGSLIAGSANLTGNAKIIFDPNVLGNARRLGKAAMVPGSWRDW